MKKITLIISSVLFLFSSTELHEFFRLPFFLNHFYQHQSNDPQLSLFDFLNIHYSGNHPYDNDETDDNELPFKSKGDLSYLNKPVPVHHESSEKQIFLPDKKPCIQYAEGLPDKKSFSIFHPPRMVQGFSGEFRQF